ADPEDHELGRLHGSPPDLDDELPDVDDLGRVGLLVALDVERLLGVLTHEGAVAPHEREERRDGARHALPQAGIVRLEHHPLRGALDRRLHHDEETANVDIAPRRIRRQRAGAPDADAAAHHHADAVDALRVEDVLLTLGDGVLEAERAADDLVRGRLVNAALVVDAGVDAGHVARRRNVHVAALRIVDLDPREVVRAVLRVARARQLVDAALHDFRRVEDRETILAHLAVREQRVLHRRRNLAGRRDERDLVDLLEALETRARAGTVVLADVERLAAAAARLGRSLGSLFGLVAFFRRTRRLGLRRSNVQRRRSADVDDEAARSTVVEEPINGMGQVGRLREVTEGLGVLRPVGDQHGLVGGSHHGFPEETHGVGADRLDRLGPAIYFFYVNAR